MKLRTTLADIARRAGVSKATVSLALRDSAKIPEATRQRIREAATALDYRPDPALARIAAHRWQTKNIPSGSTVAFVTTNHPNGDCLDLPALLGAQCRAAELGYRVEHHRLEQYASPAHLGRTLFHRGIQGVIVGQLFAPGFAAGFPWEKFASVACNVGYFPVPVNLVMPDHARAVALAWQRAVERGYRRIGLVLFDEYEAIDDQDKVGAFLYCQASIPAECRLPVIHVRMNDHADMKAWLKQHGPDMILGMNNVVRYWAQLCDWRAPGDVGFIDLYLHSAQTVSSGLFLDNQQLGSSALELVDMLVQHNAYGLPAHKFTHLLTPTWKEGDSSPCKVALPVAGKKRRKPKAVRME